MKEIKKEIQKLIATWLMNWAFSVMPDCSFKIKYADFMSKEIINF